MKLSLRGAIGWVEQREPSFTQWWVYCTSDRPLWKRGREYGNFLGKGIEHKWRETSSTFNMFSQRIEASSHRNLRDAEPIFLVKLRETQWNMYQEMDVSFAFDCAQVFMTTAIKWKGHTWLDGRACISWSGFSVHISGACPWLSLQYLCKCVVIPSIFFKFLNF